MPIKLIIPQPSENKSNVKDIVFSILSKEYPISLNKIFHKIKKQYSNPVTYQGVRKAVDSLKDEKVLIKENKEYKINKEWILHAKNFLLRIEKAYLSRNKEVEITVSGKDYTEYKFSSLYELDLFWTEILLDRLDNFSISEKKILSARVGYLWWMLINIGNETKLVKEILSKGVKFYISTWKKDSLNKWGLNINKKIGAKISILKEGLKRYIDLNVIGDYIIEIKYPEKIIKKLESFYNKHIDSKNMNTLELSNICHEKSEIIFKYFKDPVIAEVLRKDILKSF